jgi:hypothetical protein
MTTLLAPVRREIIVSPSQLRDSHHRVLRLAARGLRNNQIADLTGYSDQRISMILNSPAAQDVLARYREQILAATVTEAAADAEIDLRTMRLAKTQRLDRLVAADESGDLLPIRDYNAIIADVEDRYGVPKKSTSINLNADFAAELERALSRSASDTNIVEVEPTPEGGIRRRV